MRAKRAESDADEPGKRANQQERAIHSAIVVGTRHDWHTRCSSFTGGPCMIRKLKSGEYRLYSRKKDPKTGQRRNLGTFRSRAAAERHERAVQFFKRH
jgi:hypothetical protein